MLAPEVCKEPMKGPGKRGAGEGENLRMSSLREYCWKNVGQSPVERRHQSESAHLADILVKGRERDAHRQRRPLERRTRLKDVRVALAPTKVPVAEAAARGRKAVARRVGRHRSHARRVLLRLVLKEVERRRKALGRRRWRRRGVGEDERRER